MEAAVEETLSYYAFPEEHWRRIRTNNPLERILREDPAAHARREVPQRGRSRRARSSGTKSGGWGFGTLIG